MLCTCVIHVLWSKIQATGQGEILQAVKSQRSFHVLNSQSSNN